MIRNKSLSVMAAAVFAALSTAAVAQTANQAGSNTSTTAGQSTAPTANTTVNTDARGTVAGAVSTMAPFAGWKGVSPLDTWRVALGDGVNSANIADIQIFYSYAFNYRPDGSLA